MITTDNLKGMFKAISNKITDNQAVLNQLDAALGDGDHGTGISNGFQAAVDAIQDAKTPSDVFKNAATALMNRMGGSAGALYGTLFLKCALFTKGQEELTAEVVVGMLLSGRDGVMQRGKSQLGDKTMVDALSPAVDALEMSYNHGTPLVTMFEQAAAAAIDGAEQTADMQAKHGRAKYVGERSVGNIDAGAKSIALMFEAIYEYWKDNEHGKA